MLVSLRDCLFSAIFLRPIVETDPRCAWRHYFESCSGTRARGGDHPRDYLSSADRICPFLGQEIVTFAPHIFFLPFFFLFVLYPPSPPQRNAKYTGRLPGEPRVSSLEGGTTSCQRRILQSGSFGITVLLTLTRERHVYFPPESFPQKFFSL